MFGCLIAHLVIFYLQKIINIFPSASILNKCLVILVFFMFFGSSQKPEKQYSFYFFYFLCISCIGTIFSLPEALLKC